jgi:hypothetical protein
VSGGRALSLQHTIITPADRERFLQRARQLRDHYTHHRCQYWVFEEADLSGAFLEFTEAGDPASLAAALASAPDSVVDPARIYQEVSL